MLVNGNKWLMQSHSLLGDLLLITSGGLLLLLVLLLGLGDVNVFESLELFNQESSLDSVSDFETSEDTTVSSGDSSLGWSQSSEVIWSSNFDTLHSSSSGVFFNVVQHNSSACINHEWVQNGLKLGNWAWDDTYLGFWRIWNCCFWFCMHCFFCM